MLDHLIDRLSKQDFVAMMEMINRSISFSNEEGLKSLVVKLGELMHFDFFTCAVAQMNKDQSLKSYKIVNLSYPEEWLRLYNEQRFDRIDPIALENYSRFGLQYWADTYHRRLPPKRFISIAEDFDLRNGYSHGVKNVKKNEGSIFSFSGRSIKKNNRTAAILDYVVPHLNEVLSRILNKERRYGAIRVSPREREILCWLREGKTSWDISKIVGISERTTNFHIYNIKEKLGVVNRTQLVAVAVQSGLIELT